MANMNWKQLLSGKRFGMDHIRERKHNRTDFRRDYDRLIFSSPFRRLQNKTQVFPLPGSIFVHNRLTHSLEVACVGRSLSDSIGMTLRKKHGSDHLGPNAWEFGAITSAACLAHDMGNPPFGHAGEKAIQSYFREGNGTKWKKAVEKEGGRWTDFTSFEGNANVMRLLTHQFQGRRKGGFAMTYSTIASVVKYPYASMYAGQEGKFGFFQSEQQSYESIANELGICSDPTDANKYARYPLVFLVEAADDICYQVMDIEDAFKLHILDKEEALDLLLNFFESKEKIHIKKIMNLVNDDNEQLAYVRSSVINLLVQACKTAFIEKEEAILAGDLHHSLINSIGGQAQQAYEACSTFAFEKIYRSRDVLDVELAGYRIFSHLIDTLTEAIISSDHTYSKLLLRGIPSQYDTAASTTYGKLQCVLDYISGMTDVYALDFYRKINGMNLPDV